MVGEIYIAATQNSVTHVGFGKMSQPSWLYEENDVIVRACAQLEEYFNKKRQVFDLPLAPCGTPFYLRVWKELQKIPYGQTRSYKDIAIAAGCPKGYRAVGMANHNNPIAIIIPCHRVIGADGKLGGYAGGISVKKTLLELEGTF